MIPYVTYIIGNTSVIYMIDKWDNEKDATEKCTKVATHKAPCTPVPSKEQERE